MKASTLKKTISLAGVLAAGAAFASEGQKAIDEMTGPNQARENAICVKVEPYSLGSRGGDSSKFHSFLIKGVSQFARGEKGECQEVGADGVCEEKGYVKITSTAPISCHVPVAL